MAVYPGQPQGCSEYRKKRFTHYLPIFVGIIFNTFNYLVSFATFHSVYVI